MVLAEMSGARASSSQGKGASLKGADMRISLTHEMRYPVNAYGSEKAPGNPRLWKFVAAQAHFDKFVMPVTQLSFDIRARCRAKRQSSGVGYEQNSSEAIMPAYEICYLDEEATLTYKFSADCDDDQRAKVLAHAMKLPSAKKLEVWSGETLIYTRPSVIAGAACGGLN